MALGGEVELRDAVVAGGGHRLDVAVLGIDRDDRRGRADRPEVALDRRAGLLLLVEVDRRIDLHAAHADGARAVLAEQLVLDVVEEVLLAPAREVGRELDAELPLRRPVRGGRRDHPELLHLAQDLVAALLGRSRGARRGVVRGRLRQAGEQRRLVQVELLEPLGEEDPGRGLDADRRLPADRAVRDRVEVLVEDPLLGVGLLELLGELGLADLALVGALARDVERAHELHRDRRPALDGLARREVLHGRAHDALVVDALVLVVALVLDRDRRVLDHLRDFLGGHRQMQVVGLDPAERLAVGGVDARVVARRLGLERGQRRCGGGDRDDVADRAKTGQHGDDAEHHQRQECLVARSSAAAPPPLVARHLAHRGTHECRAVRLRPANPYLLHSVLHPEQPLGVQAA